MVSQRLLRVTDVALTGQEHQNVAGAFRTQLIDSAADTFILVDVVTLVVKKRFVAYVDRVGTSGHLDDRCGVFRCAEVTGKALRIDRGGGDDDLQIRARRKQAGEVPQDEIDVEGAFVGLVDNQSVVTTQQWVRLDLSEQNAVSHEFHQRRRADLVSETNLVAHNLAGFAPHFLPQFVGDTFSNSVCGEAARLSVSDHAGHAAPQLQTDLRKLGRLA